MPLPRGLNSGEGYDIGWAAHLSLELERRGLKSSEIEALRSGDRERVTFDWALNQLDIRKEVKEDSPMKSG